MNLLTLDNITKAYTDRKLLEDTSFYLHQGEKVGVIGVNGTGKSTLLKLMAGLEEPDSGTVIKANNVVTRYLPQNPTFEKGDSVLSSVLRGNVTKENQWNVESEAKTMLTQVGIFQFDQPTEQLSGGQKKRLALVSTLMASADILIMDEPTNHLDNEMADWLEEFLKKWRGALVMVTHDRYFLDSVSNRIVEIDEGKIYSYQTNYTGFITLKAERETMELASERKRQSILRTELEWIQRGARARSTKQKARIERFESLKNQKGPGEDQKVELSSITTRLGRTTLEAEQLFKSYDEKQLIRDFSYIFLKGDRVGFLGKNGCGKTTLMKVLAGKLEADSGQVVVGQTVKIGYYTQEIEQEEKESGITYMNPEERVIDYIRNVAEFVQTTEGSVTAAKMLERFLFEGSAQYNLIGKLSGGEKRRLHLLRVLMEAPNVLILDEPTNDLDITTLTILEDYLDSFDGIVITVSHDRYFLDRTVSRIFAFEENGQIRQYEGGYTDYKNKKEAEKEEQIPIPVEQQKKDNRIRVKKLKFTYLEQKEYDTIETDIAQLEEKLEKLEGDMEKAASDFVKLNELSKEKEQVEQTLEEKMQRWIYLEDLAQKITDGVVIEE